MGKSSGGGQVAGYRYKLCMLMGISRGPVNELVQINADDIPIWTGGGVVSNTQIQIDMPEVFGGDQKEGGIQGPADIMFGAADQSTIGTNVEAYIGGRTEVPQATAFGVVFGDILPPLVVDDGPYPPIDGLRGVLTLFYMGLICSNSPYPKPWTFRIRRTTAGWFNDDPWYPEEAQIALADGTGDPIIAMNGSHILVEALTNPVWGRGLPRSRLDLDSFTSAANTLCREKFGLCLLWQQEMDVQDFMQSVINHIGGSLYTDRATGLIVLKLLRKDYNVEDLPVFDYSSGLLAVQDDQTTSPDNSHSEIVVEWTDPITGDVRETRVQNLAGTQANETVASVKTQYLGLPTVELAARVGMRDLEAQSAGIKRYTLVMDRRARKITPGSVFRVNVPDRNINDMVLRAGKINDGPIGQQVLTVTAVQDVFGLRDTTYVVEPPKTWVPPDKSLNPVSLYTLQEMTYRDAVRTLSTSDLASLPVDDGGINVAARAPTGLSTAYQFNSAGSGEAYANRGTFHWTPNALLDGAVGYYDETIIIKNTSLLADAVLPSVAWIDDEMVYCTAYDFSTRTLTVGRGAVDTLPQEHSDGARIWFPENAMGVDGREYTTGEDVNVKLLTQTNAGTLRIVDAPAIPITIQGRQGLPYPPGDFKINGTPFAEVTSETGDIAFTWAHRDRITQSDHVLVHTDGSTGPETDVTYTLRVYNFGDPAVKGTHSGITDDNYTYDTATQASDGVGGHITIRLRAERGGLISFQEYVWSFYRVSVGYGHGYGLSYGRG